jgi:hypothetical protein
MSDRSLWEGRPKLEILFFAIIVAIFLIFAFFSHQQAQQRLQELAALATEIGWRFDSDKNRLHDEQYRQFDIFHHGHSRYAFNTLTGSIDALGRTCPVKMGDYRYQETTTDNKGHSTTHTYTFSYLIAHLPFQRLPELAIRTEGLFDLVKRAFGFDDIDFESVEFSKRFHVTSSDKRFAYDVIHPGMIEFMLAYDPPTIEVAGDCLCLVDGQDWQASDFRRTLSFAERFIELWPRHLTSTLAARDAITEARNV